MSKRGRVLLLSCAAIGGCDTATPPPERAPSTSSCEATAATGDEPLIDDFESQTAALPAAEGRAGSWFTYDDGTNGALAVERLPAEDGADEGGVLHVTASGFTTWGSSAAVVLHPQSTQSRACGYDASHYTGIRLRARGTGSFRMMLPTVANTPVAEGGTCTLTGENCYDQAGAVVELTEDWAEIELPFCAFQPEGWGGGAVDFDAGELVGIHLRITFGQEFEMWLDELAFSESPPPDPDSCGSTCPLDVVPAGVVVDPEATNAPQSDELTLHVFEQDTAKCGPLPRRYLSYVPERLEAETDAPILMFLNGSGTNAEDGRAFMTKERFDELAAAEGFIVVYANAAPGRFSNAAVPNSGSWRQDYFDDGQVDDLDYLLRVLADLEARGVTNGDNPVYLTGISNGGGMVLEAAKRAPERFAGIAPFMAFDGFDPTPAPDLNGTGLKKVFFAYSSTDPGVPDGYHEVLETLPAAWGRALGFEDSDLTAALETPIEDVVEEGADYEGSAAVALATRDSTGTVRDVTDPETGAHLRVLVLDHAGHFWPNPVQDTEDWVLDRWGFRNQDFDAAEAVWEFFSAEDP